MSSDTAREDASVVDSSVTEWKHDMGNSDGPESSSYKPDEDGYRSRARGGNSYDLVETSHANKNDKLYKTRYFIIKSLNYDNIQLSIEKGIWATQVMNEPILEEAFHNSGKVILIFSVNMSGFFQGYAQMMSSVGWRRDNVWSQGSGKSNPWGRSFKVKWLQLNDLPFQKTLHLKNPLNDYKPVKISRDCQELPEDIGEALCELLDGKNDEEGSLYRYDQTIKRPCTDAPCSLGNEEYNMPPLHFSWPGAPIPYPSVLYQTEASRFHVTQQRDSGVLEHLHVASGASKVGRMRPSTTESQAEWEMSPRFDLWGWSAESPLASTLTEDDFLEMSYEEYLEAHSRRIKQVVAPSWMMQESSSKKNDDDSNSSFVNGGRRSCKRARKSTEK